MYDELLMNINDTLSEITRLRNELVADPTLVDNDHWREHLETAAYRATENLATEDF